MAQVCVNNDFCIKVDVNSFKFTVCDNVFCSHCKKKFRYPMKT